MAENFEEGSVCMPNLGPKERQKRLRFGMVSGGIAAVAAAGTLAAGASPFARLLVFLPAVGAAYGYFQAKEQT